MAVPAGPVRYFFSLTAVFQGLREAGLDKRILSNLFIFISTENNYAAYRGILSRERGLPYLLHHLGEHKHCQVRRSSDIFTYTTYRANLRMLSPVISVADLRRDRSFWRWSQKFREFATRLFGFYSGRLSLSCIFFVETFLELLTDWGKSPIPSHKLSASVAPYILSVCTNRWVDEMRVG